MIPLHLSLSGFLSYRDPVEIDFTTFDLACIAGPNGAGKSSLLDAITWVLFGQARKRDDTVINNQSAAAQVSLIFALEGNTYRVLRAKQRDKTTLLEFHILDQSTPAATWRPLTEHSLRETEARLQSILRLDYDTFINASFFLQGKADLFTQQRPGDRKRILSTILGLEVWETYQQRAAERRRAVETEIEGLDGRMQEINAELSEEARRKSRLQELEGSLHLFSQQRLELEKTLTSIRQIAATLAEQKRLVDTLGRQAEHSERRRDETQARLENRRQERETYAEILSNAGEIEAAYAAWQAQRLELERMEQVASQFREQEKRRNEPLGELQSARARLEQEQLTLQAQEQALLAAQPEIEQLHLSIEAVRLAIAADEQKLAEKAQRETELQDARQRQADARAENARLKTEMEQLKTRINRLVEADVSASQCPLCGQPLSPDDRQALLDDLNEQGKEMGDRYRANQALVRELDALVSGLETEIVSLVTVESALRLRLQSLAQHTTRLDLLASQQQTWEASGAPRLGEIRAILESEGYAPEARQRLAQVDADLKAIGYDAALHDAARQAEAQGRTSEARLRSLEQARAALAPLEREITDLQSQLAAQEKEARHQRQEYETAALRLAQDQAQAPSLEAAEKAFFDLKEEENRLRLEVGAARQKVAVLDDLKTRRKSLEARREELALQVRQYKQLERAFSKDGVPALLIEQALPEIEGRANEILDRLSNSSMSVRFITQAAYKDKKRDDLKETLDIQISDGAGARDYEMFSGGEAFRVNFAIRLALSNVLARRAGARLQTLVIDEGFGSQDAQGRQRLVEAINMVRPDFAKILVITHIDELKDAFPTRLEVEKTDRGSLVKVV